MGFYIKYDDIRALMGTTNNQFTIWQDEIKVVIDRVKQVSEMESFRGNTAESVKTYFNEIHNLLLSSIIGAISDYNTKVLLYSHGYYAIDSDIHTKVSEDTLNDAKSKYSTSRTSLEEQSQKLVSKLNEISDIFYMPAPRNTSIIDNYQNIDHEIPSLKEKIIQYDSSKLSTDLANLEKLIAAVKANIKDYSQSGSNGASKYKAGDYAKGAHIVDLANQLQVSMDYNKQNTDEIKAAADNEKQVYDQLMAEYKEACENRKDQGQAQMIMAGLTIFVGAVAIVATAGMATPIVVTAAVAGSSTIAYGVSNGVEGAENYYYGSIGDPYTTAFNPIRDTVFCGNQSAYDLWGNVSMTVSSLVVPVGTAATSAKLAGTSITKAAIREGAKTLIIETTADGLTGMATNYIGDKLDLSQTEQTILNIGLGAVTEKGMETGLNKTKFGNVGVNSFGEQMSGAEISAYNDHWTRLEIEQAGGMANLMDEADALRYNKFVDESIAGVHNPPGMDTADVARFNKGSQQLDIKIANSKVNVNDVIALRQAEALKQKNLLVDNKNVGDSDVTKLEKPDGVGKDLKGATDPKKIKYYRVQSEGESGSFERLKVNEDGTISVLTDNSNMNLSAVTDEHAQYFLNEVRQGEGYIIEFEVDDWFHEMVMENAIPQAGYRKSALNQGKTAPKIVDPTKPRPNATSISFEFPPIWNDFFEEVAHNAKILKN